MSRTLRGGIVAALMALCPLDLMANPAHHPDAAPAGAPAVTPAAPPPESAPMAPMGSPAAPPGAPAAAPGMGGMMGEMMGKMMAPASTAPIYPSLMTLPAITPEKRAEIDALADQQIKEGTELHAKGHESLMRAMQSGDHAGMQQAVGLMREGLDQLGAGIAARRVLLEGKAPRNLALNWFKREMNLASPTARNEPSTVLGVTPLHLFTMVLLAAFALAMIAMYFFKMRRTAALFGRIEGGSGPPPPGSSPPLSGAPVPADSQPPRPSA